MSARWRLLTHFVAAAWALWWLGGMPPMQLVRHAVDLGPLGQLLGTVGLVWLLNLYNFMDGIDGIAGVETVTACAGAAVVYALAPAPGLDWLPPALLGAATLGFLLWNFPRARIFLGDVGSGFLGLTLGILAVRAAWAEPIYLWSWLILLGVFVVDATFTLLRRLYNRGKVYQAHRSHAYQHAAILTRNHRRVTLSVGAINLFWLFPLAAAAATRRMNGPLACLIAYAPLVWAAARLNAGRAATVE